MPVIITANIGFNMDETISPSRQALVADIPWRESIFSQQIQAEIYPELKTELVGGWATPLKNISQLG